ncbi:allophanate hydrolase subunit 1 [Vibrio fluvialis]|uniref:5-oxoprolinase subunit B family protein n=1 Tax=Vibrio fluvialis TaxID=676 RepID=UPI001EE9C631|nr:allophanate hydrolase subunit 1 [Vibrio fluvialis]MCG6405993.1 allophanate hydrolase subunit 1 [Vibrio fluvialis]
MRLNYSIEQVAESSLLIRFDHQAHASLSLIIGEIAKRIRLSLGDYVMNVTPSYTTILIDYLPYRIAPQTFAKRVIQCIEKATEKDAQPAAAVELPVYYHPDVGPDLALYQQQGLSLDDVIALHSKQTYTVCAIGFAPGFAFMTDVAEPLRRPRHATPRLSLPAGSVAVAEQQTAVYPNASPGGWNIIGNCPLPLFTPDTSPMIPWGIGSQVTFRAISRDEFLELGGIIAPEQFQWGSAR